MKWKMSHLLGLAYWSVALGVLALLAWSHLFDPFSPRENNILRSGYLAIHYPSTWEFASLTPITLIAGAWATLFNDVSGFVIFLRLAYYGIWLWLLIGCAPRGARKVGALAALGVSAIDLPHQFLFEVQLQSIHLCLALILAFLLQVRSNRTILMGGLLGVLMVSGPGPFLLSLPLFWWWAFEHQSAPLRRSRLLLLLAPFVLMLGAGIMMGSLRPLFETWRSGWEWWLASVQTLGRGFSENLVGNTFFQSPLALLCLYFFSALLGKTTCWFRPVSFVSAWFVILSLFKLFQLEEALPFLIFLQGLEILAKLNLTGSWVISSPGILVLFFLCLTNLNAHFWEFPSSKDIWTTQDRIRKIRYELPSSAKVLDFDGNFFRNEPCISTWSLDANSAQSNWYQEKIYEELKKKMGTCTHLVDSRTNTLLPPKIQKLIGDGIKNLIQL